MNAKTTKTEARKTIRQIRATLRDLEASIKSESYMWTEDDLNDLDGQAAQLREYFEQA